jgi:hypothetical protein
MITVSEQISKKRQSKRDTNCWWWPLWEYLYVCVWTIISFFFSFSTLRVLMALGKEMRTGGLYERKHIDNCQYKTEEEICGNNRHDQLLLSFPLFLRFFWFICLLSSFVLVFPYLKWIRIDFLSLSLSFLFLSV